MLLTFKSNIGYGFCIFLYYIWMENNIYCNNFNRNQSVNIEFNFYKLVIYIMKYIYLNFIQRAISHFVKSNFLQVESR